MSLWCQRVQFTFRQIANRKQILHIVCASPSTSQRLAKVTLINWIIMPKLGEKPLFLNHPHGWHHISPPGRPDWKHQSSPFTNTTSFTATFITDHNNLYPWHHWTNSPDNNPNRNVCDKRSCRNQLTWGTNTILVPHNPPLCKFLWESH